MLNDFDILTDKEAFSEVDLFKEKSPTRDREGKFVYL